MTTPARRYTTLCGRLAIAATAVLAAAPALTACSADESSIAAQAKAGDRKGYISGDGTVETLAPASRGDRVALSGTTLTGEAWSAHAYLGQLVVVNVWASWCPPCIEEMPALQGVWAGVSAARKPVQFIGISFREGTETALAFLTKSKITFPSLAYDGGTPLLALQGKAAALPSTLVLDTRGRIAARVNGPVDRATLAGLVDDVLAEGGTAAGSTAGSAAGSTAGSATPPPPVTSSSSSRPPG